MDEHLDFTTGSKFGDQANMVDQLHARGLHYIMILVIIYTIIFLNPEGGVLKVSNLVFMPPP